MREPPTGLARADCVVITRADDSQQTEELHSEIKELSKGSSVFRSRMRICGVRSITGQEGYAQILANGIKSSPVVAFCGIGNPESFFSLLRRSGYALCHTEVFRDHHVYSQADIDRVGREAIARGALTLLTTVKDEVKLRSLTFSFPCFAVDIAIEIDNKAGLSSLIEKSLGNHRAVVARP